MTVVLIALATVLGLLLGSFANVLIHRVPRELSIVSPPSACPACGARVRTRHNVPVLGWFMLRGHCRDCNAPISARYVVVELVMGVAFGLAAWATGPGASTAILLVLVFFGLVLAVIDVETRRLPDPLTLSFAVAVVATIVATSFVTGDWPAALRAVVGAAALGALYLVAFLIYPRGMGFGDVKLAPSLGAVLAFLGWPQLVVGAFAAFVWGAAVGIVAMRRARQAKGVAIPFGPWMVLGALSGVMAGVPVAHWYLNLVLVS